MIDIGWLNTYDSKELHEADGNISSPFVTYQPERYVRKASNKYTRFLFTNCPAFVQFNQNLFVIKSPIDINLELRSNPNDRNIYECLPRGEKVHPLAYSRMIQYEGDPNNQADFGIPHLQLKTPYVFYADQPVTIQLLPAFYENQELPGRIIPGAFDIHAWQRSINWAFEWTERSKPLSINRGDPLYYVNFIVHNKPNEKVKLTRLKANENTVKPILRAQGTAHMVMKSFDLFEIARKWRAPKYITKENTWKPGD